jgi:hypothetical protein
MIYFLRSLNNPSIKANSSIMSRKQLLRIRDPIEATVTLNFFEVCWFSRVVYMISHKGRYWNYKIDIGLDVRETSFPEITDQ